MSYIVRSRRGRRGTLFVNGIDHRADNDGNYDLDTCRDCEVQSLKDKMMAKTRETHITEPTH